MSTRDLAGSVSEIPEGIYRDVVKGVESGHCTARIQGQVAPNGCRIVDYEAVSDEHGLQHIEHGMLTADPLHVAFGEPPGATTFHASGVGVYETVGEPRMQIRVSYVSEVQTWAWHWGTGSDDIIERSRAICRRADC